MRKLYKKAQTSSGSKTVYYLFYGLFLLPITFLLISASNYYANSYSYMDEQTVQVIYAERVFSCFAAQDTELSRTYPVLDLSLMTDQRLNDCFVNSYKGIRVVLEDWDSKQDLITLRNNAQDIPQKRIPYYVVYKDAAGKIKNGILKVEISPS